MKQILCLSTEPWSAAPGRTQQLISRLRDAEILYFAPQDPAERQIDPRKGRKVRPRVTVYPLPPALFQGEEGHLFFHLSQRRLCRFLDSRAAAHRFRQPLLWTTSPEHVHLLDHLDYGGLVYDCGRSWDDLPPQWEGSLAAAADVVFAASPQLAQRLAPCSPNIALLPNGANYPLFAEENASRPDPLPRVSGPVLGWAGTIRPGLDLSPLLYAAQAEPDWTFVLLGPSEGNRLLSRLQALPNVVTPGVCPLSQVPDWLHRCDVLLEFLREDQPEDVVSPRLYEYLSTGKPVVSMLWPDQVELFPDVVYAARTEEDFVTMCRHALEEAPGFADLRRRRGEAASWSNRAGEVARILDAAGLL